MSKKIMVISAIVVLLAGGYWLIQKPSIEISSSGHGNSTLLARVPADTAWFLGGLKNMPLINPYDKDSTQIIKTYTKDSFSQLETSAIGFKSPAFSMLMSLYLQALDEIYTDTKKEMNAFAFYSLGIYPVVAWQSTAPNEFLAQLDSIEKENNITATRFSLGKANYREYEISKDLPIKLYITVNDNIVSLGTTSKNEKILKLLAGTELPERSLSDSDKLSNIITRHKLLPYALFYFDANLAMQNAASSDDNLLKQSIAEVSNSKVLDNIIKDACFADIASIISRWPKMVFGYRKLDYANNPINMEGALIFENTDAQFLSSLKSVSGLIPEYSFKQDILSFGLGINVDNLASFISDFRQSVINENYQCKGLVEIQSAFKQFNPAMIAMSTQMLSGVKGVAMNLTKLDAIAASKGDISATEGMLTILSSNPKNLLLAAGNFYPPLAQMTLNPDGSSQPLSLPNGVAASVSMSDNALVLLLGNSAESKQRITAIHKGEGLSPALFEVGLNFSSYLKILKPLMDKFSPQSLNKDMEQLENMKQMFTILEKLNMRFSYMLTVEPKGIVLSFKIKMDNNHNN